MATSENKEVKKVICDTPAKKARAIKTWVKNHPTPIQELCPVIIIHWSGTKNKEKYHKYWNSYNNKTVEKGHEVSYELIEEFDIPENRVENWRNIHSSSGLLMAVYVKYIEKYDMIEFANILFKCARYKEGEKNDWFYDCDSRYKPNRVFLFKGDRNGYNSKGDILWKDDKGKFYNTALARWIGRELNGQVVKAASEEFYKFAGTSEFPISSWTKELRWPWSWAQWYKKVQPRPISDKQEDINEILLMPLTDLTPMKNNMEEETGDSGYYYRESTFGKPKKKGWYFEIVNDDYCVFRLVNPNIEADYEQVRVYIDNKGKPTITSYSPVTESYQITSSNINTLCGYSSENIHLINVEDIKKWKQISWIYDSVQALNRGKKTNLMQNIITTLRHPIIESLCKSGYPYIASELISQNQVAANIKEAFGVKDTKTGNLYQRLKVNKYVLKKVESDIKDMRTSENYRNCYYTSGILDIIKQIKRVYNTDDITHLSEETVNEVYEGLSLIHDKGYDIFRSIFPEYDPHYNWRTREYESDFVYDENKQRYLIKQAKRGTKNSTYINSYCDALHSWRNITQEDRPNASLFYNIRNEEDAIHYHNALLQILNEQRARYGYCYGSSKENIEKRQKKFEELQDGRRQKYNWNPSNYQYLIKVPENLGEITTEGQVLGHCVASYTGNHAIGDTNIIFMRKKESPDVPFFTIEVRNGRLIQAHGSRNRWPGSEGIEAAKFLREWLVCKGISYDINILLCKSPGFSACNADYLNEADIAI